MPRLSKPVRPVPSRDQLFGRVKIKGRPGTCRQEKWAAREGLVLDCVKELLRCSSISATELRHFEEQSLRKLARIK